MSNLGKNPRIHIFAFYQVDNSSDDTNHFDYFD